MERFFSAMVFALVIMVSVLMYRLYSWRTYIYPATPESELPKFVQIFPGTLPSIENGYYHLRITLPGDIKMPVYAFKVTNEKVILSADGRVVTSEYLPIPQSDFPESASICIAATSNLDVNDCVEFLSGEFKDDRANFKMVELMLDDAKGAFQLATPTDGDNLINERSGVWFGDISENTSRLNLPTLPMGWVYEGWAVVDNQPLTTGRFKDTNSADSLSTFSSLKAESPSFPGEDFLFDPPIQVFPEQVFPVDLAGQIINISVEPDIAGKDPTGSSPFPINILTARVPSRPQTGTLFSMRAVESGFEAAVVIRIGE